MKRYIYLTLLLGAAFHPMLAQNFVNQTPDEIATEYAEDLQALLGLSDAELKKVKKIHLKYFKKKERFQNKKTSRAKKQKAIKKRDKAMQKLLSNKQFQLYQRWLNQRPLRNKGRLKSV